MLLTAVDGASASIAVPFPPLTAGDELTVDDLVTQLVTHVLAPRTVGAVLVRKGGHAVGVFVGSSLVSSKVGSAYVQGKTKAGGWSQQRYARRRANQTDQAYAEAADVAVAQLVPRLAELEAVVGGGDRVAVHAVLADPRLTGVLALLREPVLPTPDPRLRVLVAFSDQFRAISIWLNALA